ncbi:MAG: phenylalanine--tRNA ligase subunit beta, partial [Alphaproteobacteria bacterium]
MKFTLGWLKEHLDTSSATDEIAKTLTFSGLEVEEIIDHSKSLKDFIVAEILQAEKHPNADSLRLCQVFDGTNNYSIVCGASNARAGIKVVLAKEGVVIPASKIIIKKTKIRGVESNGMLCSAEELGLENQSSGIIELPNNAELGLPAINYLGNNDPIIEIAITPNRGDCLSVRNIARDLAAKGIGKLKPFQNNKIEEKSKSLVKAKSSVPNTIFFGRTIKNVNNISSPTWLKERLEAIGIKPFSALVDISNFVCYNLGHPNHIYSLDKIRGDLEIKFSQQKNFHALNGKSYNLDNILVIADDAGAKAVAGVIGGEDSACPIPNDKKIDVFVEVAYFPPEIITSSGRKLDVLTDSRYRFERGVNPLGLEEALNHITNLILQICGGEASHITKVDNLNFSNTEINFDFNLTNQLLGFTIPSQKQKEILQSLGCEVEGHKITVPAWRSDIKIPQDLIEEIARIYGYEHLPETPLNFTPINPFSAKDSLINNFRQTIKPIGYKETLSFAFVEKTLAENFLNEVHLINLQNPISKDLSTMRPSIICNLINTLDYNLKHGMQNLQLFEVGNVFLKTLNNYQELSLASISYGLAEKESHYKTTRSFDIYDAKLVAENLLSHITKPENLTLKRLTPSYFHPTRSGAYFMGKNPVCYFGEIHPSITQKY